MASLDRNKGILIRVDALAEGTASFQTQQGARNGGRVGLRKDVSQLEPRIPFWPVSKWVTSVNHINSQGFSFLTCQIVKNGV